MSRHPRWLAILHQLLIGRIDQRDLQKRASDVAADREAWVRVRRACSTRSMGRRSRGAKPASPAKNASPLHTATAESLQPPDRELAYRWNAGSMRYASS